MYLLWLLYSLKYSAQGHHFWPRFYLSHCARAVEINSDFWVYYSYRSDICKMYFRILLKYLYEGILSTYAVYRLANKLHLRRGQLWVLAFSYRFYAVFWDFAVQLSGLTMEQLDDAGC